MPKSKELDYYLSKKNQVDRITSYLQVPWQDGPIGESGVNGALPEDVLQVAKERLAELNKPPYNTRETSLAITAIEDAQNWLLRRRIMRHNAGTLGTSEV